MRMQDRFSDMRHILSQIINAQTGRPLVEAETTASRPSLADIDVPMLLAALAHRDDEDFHRGWLMRAYEAMGGEPSADMIRDLGEMLGHAKEILARFDRGRPVMVWRGSTRPLHAPYGVHWADDRAAAEAHGEHVVSAQVAPDQIDWIATVYRRICWPKEREISLFPDARIEIA